MAAKKKVPAIPFAKQAEKEFEDLKGRWKPLHALAQRAYDAQDAMTQDALDVMVERIIAISRGAVVFSNRKGDKLAFQIDENDKKMNALYLATEIMKDLAQLDIRLASYKFLPNVCVECGSTTTKAKKKARR